MPYYISFICHLNFLKTFTNINFFLLLLTVKMSSANYTDPIEWDDEEYLRQFIKVEMCKKPRIGIESKRTQIIDFMFGADLTCQLKFKGKIVGRETNKMKKEILEKLVNDTNFEDTTSVDDVDSDGDLSVQSVQIIKHHDNKRYIKQEESDAESLLSVNKIHTGTPSSMLSRRKNVATVSPAYSKDNGSNGKTSF